MPEEEEAQAGLTAEQERLVNRMDELQTADDWRGIAALESGTNCVDRTERMHRMQGIGWLCGLHCWACLGLECNPEEEEAQAGLTAEQERLVHRMDELQTAYDWRGIAALESAAMALARDLRLAHPAAAGAIHSMLGNAYDSLGDFSRAIEYHTQDLAIAREVGDRAGEGSAYGNLGSAYKSLGDFSRAIEYHTQHLAIAREVGDRAGEGRAYGNLGVALEKNGDLPAAARALVQGLAAKQRVERDLGGHDDRRVSLFEEQQTTYMVLQRVLLGLEQPGWALGVAAQAKGRALLYHLTAGINEDHASMIATEEYEDVCAAWWREVQQDAQAEGDAGAERIVEYSFLFDDRLAIWVLKGTGELLGSTTVSARVGGGRTVGETITAALETMGVRGRDAMVRQAERERVEDAVQEDASPRGCCRPYAVKVGRGGPRTRRVHRSGRVR